MKANRRPLERMEDLVSLCARRGLIYPSSEIYGGINGFWDYGPLGVELKQNLKARWWQSVVRMREDVESRQAPRFVSVDEYARIVTHNYPATTGEAALRMARDELKQCEDGLYELKMDPALRGAFRADETPEEAARREEEMAREQWQALARVTAPTLVVRGAASDVLSPEVADRMADEVLAAGSLAVVAQAGHSVMTDNPDGFRDAVTRLLLE